MKNNVLFIVVDSVTNNVLFNKESSKICAPFLNELRKKSISGDKMFSEGPYTEAALMALLSSVDTMDNGGYMERLKNSTCALEYFQKNNYKVFFNTYYPSIYPSYMAKGYDERLYIDGYDFMQLWEYRLKYFSDIYKTGNLTEKEINMLIDMLEDNFIAWNEYLTKIKKSDHETILLNECIDTSGIEKNIKLLEKEYAKFKKNKKEYLEKLLTQKDKHTLFKIKTYKMTDKVHNEEIRKTVMTKYKKTFKKIAKLNFKRNIINNKFPIHKFIKSLITKDFKTAKGLLAGYKNSLFDKDLYDRINYNYDMFKNQRSFYRVSEELFNWINKNKDNTWMSYVHIDDAHYTESFFTYDTDNIEIIDEDFKRIDNYLKNIPKNYKGSIAYDLSLLYCDSIIKRIYNFLEKEKLLENTSIVITADHGFSYYFFPVREKYVISSYRENYNVPFIIYNKDIKPKKINNYTSTKDIPATLLDLAGIKVPKEFKGKSLLTTNGEKYALLEYMGGGCPDITRRPIILGVRTDFYDVVMEIYINKTFEENEIKEVYNIKEDPLEHNNLFKQKNIKNKIEHELSLLKSRYNQIIREYGVK